MARIETLDPTTTLMSQLGEDTGEVVVVNTFFVPSELTEQFLAGWSEDAKLMANAPGCRSVQLHRGVGGSQLLVNIATWESTEALAAAHANPEFRRRSAALPEGIVAYPHVFEKLSVEGVC